jgi:hypothetical protein
MHDRYSELLSLYCDGDLTPGERADVDAHLESCAECRALLADIAAITRRAGALEPLEPPRDLWPGIAAAIAAGGASAAAPQRSSTAASSERDSAILPLRPTRVRRSFSFTVPQLAAAAVALIVMSSSAAFMLDLRRGGTGEDAPTAASYDGNGALAGAQLVAHVELSYEATIAHLEHTLDAARDVLDAETVAVIEQSLATIDAAIAEARAAIDADPANTHLVRHLDQTMRRKVDLLRDASRVAART